MACKTISGRAAYHVSNRVDDRILLEQRQNIHMLRIPSLIYPEYEYDRDCSE